MLTIYLGKLLGLSFMIVAVALMIQRRATIDTIDAWVRSPPLMLLVDIVIIAAGLAIVLAHNIWIGGLLPIVVTIAGWGMLAKGLVYLFLPQTSMIKLYEALQFERFFFPHLSTSLALGIVMTVAAFSAT